MTFEQTLQALMAIAGGMAATIGVLLMRMLSQLFAQVERAINSLEALNIKMAVICERVDSQGKAVDLHEKRITDLEKS